ncbi:MAG TPA: glycerophosphodiester phosphodiesterase [Terriglobales bacterium]|nr:glycerophosphodiester phosphodiesterase [Terriglobales bacterium]
MPTRTSPPLLLGHRGMRAVHVGRGRRRLALPAENTLAAFAYALANGCHGVEFDVRYSRDGRSVLCHDATLEGIDIGAADYSELQRQGYHLPSLEDALAGFSAGPYLDIELKVAGHEEALLAALRACPPQGGHVISSFLPEVLLRLQELDPSQPLGYICERWRDVPRWRELPITTLCPHYRLVSPRLIAEVHARGMKLFAWTVNEVRDMRRLAEWGVDGLISDDPELLSRTCLRREDLATIHKPASAGTG